MEFPLGTTSVTYTATDQYGNQATCSFDVIVKDVTPPTFNECPDDIRVVIQQGGCETSVTWTPPEAADNCTALITSDHQSGDTFPFGETIVTYTATDLAGNTTTCSFTVYVGNTNAPVVSGCSEDITVVADETLQAVVNWDEPIFTVSCGELMTTQSHHPGNT